MSYLKSGIKRVIYLIGEFSFYQAETQKPPAYTGGL
jgi:hypothetical protein